MQIRNIPGILILSLCVCVSNFILAENDSSKAQELSVLDEQIDALKENIGDNKDTASELEDELANVDKAVGGGAKKVSELNHELEKQQHQLAQLHQAQRQILELLDKQKEKLAVQLQAAYRLGTHEYLTLLLTQDEPSALDRVFNYLGYLNNERYAVILSLKQNMKEYSTIESKIQEKTNSLVALRDEQNKEQQQLIASKSTREALLRKLQAQLARQTNRLAQLQNNRRILEGVVAKLQLEKTEKANEVAQANELPFSHLQGHLPWPIDGRLVSRYANGDEDSHSTGIVIAAPQGQGVRVLHRGKVIFADWLKGYGLLIIVQHDNHYMSLYGRNESLYKKEGDVVNPGEVIATIGNSGGFPFSGLYFEIRHDGKPINPELWLRRPG